MKHGYDNVQMNTRRLSSAWSGHAPGWVLACLLLLSTGEGGAAITPDGTMGSVANLTGQDYSITGGTQLGSNLFHSFSVFDIHTGVDICQLDAAASETRRNSQQPPGIVRRYRRQQGV